MQEVYLYFFLNSLYNPQEPQKCTIFTFSPFKQQYHSILLNYNEIRSLEAEIRYNTYTDSLKVEWIRPKYIDVKRFYNGYHFEINNKRFIMKEGLCPHKRRKFFFPEYIPNEYVDVGILLNSGMKIALSFCTSIEGVERTELLIGDKTISLYPSGPAGSLMYFYTRHNTEANTLMLNIDEIDKIQEYIIYLEDGLRLFRIETFSDINPLIDILYRQSKYDLELGYIVTLGPIIDPYSYMRNLLNPHIYINCLKMEVDVFGYEDEIRGVVCTR